jgi:hypothetical protein
MNNIPKVVFSRALEKAGWADTRIARGDLAEEIARLKREPGNDIIAHGGATFVQAPSRLSLIDEHRLVIQPLALGERAAAVPRPARAATPPSGRGEDVPARHRHPRLPAHHSPARRSPPHPGQQRPPNLDAPTLTQPCIRYSEHAT